MLGFLLLLPFFSYLVQGKSDRVLLRSVDTLTFSANKYATSRRGHSIPQLECVGGSAHKHNIYHPRTVQCYNSGWDGSDVQWKCKAELDNNVKFGALDVSCEGYDYPNDNYILTGSCGLRYELDFRHGRREEQGSYFKPTFQYGTSQFHVLILIVLIVLAFIIWYYCLLDRRDFGFEAVNQSAHRPDESHIPYPDDPPPNYEEATRTRRRYAPRRDSNNYHPDVPPSAPPTDYGWQPFVRQPRDDSSWNSRKTETNSSSWFSNTLSAGAGFLGGYMVGSRSNDSSSRTHHQFWDGDAAHSSYRGSETVTTHRERSRSPSGTRIATGFASTSRR